MENTYAAGLDESREYLHDIHPVPLWSETGAYSAYDPTSGVGFWMHLGRFSYDPTLWHEALMVYLPDGTRLVFKNYGRSDLTRGPAGAILQFQCVDPFRRWELRYDGPAQRVTNDVLFSGGLRQGVEERMVVELTIDSVKPIWDFSSKQIEGQPWAKTHDQQLSTARGRILSDSGELTFDGMGWRDHSTGPRDMTGLEGHTILGAWFPDDDRGFVATHVRQGGHEVGVGQVFIGDDSAAISPTLPTWEDPQALPDSFGIVLPAEAVEHRVQVEVQQYAPITMMDPNHLALGMVQDPPGGLVILEGQGRFEWDGCVGYGYVERSCRI